MQKNSMPETVNFRVLWPDWSHPFLPMPTKNFFDQLLIFVNLYQHAKKISLLHLSIIEIQSILKSNHMTRQTQF